MKPKLIEFIPIYGMIKYHKRHNRGHIVFDDDYTIYSLMEAYHLVIVLFTLFTIFGLWFISYF